MNIYEKIETIFSGEAEEKPKWANEILNELQEIKLLLQEQKQQINKIDSNFYDFIKKFRISMKADIVNNIYPTFRYYNKELGVDFKGLLYDKKTSKILPREEAYKVYKYAYEHKSDLKDIA